jgi:hypothetical protein
MLKVRQPLKKKYIAYQLKIEKLAQNYEEYKTNHERIKYLKAVSFMLHALHAQNAAPLPHRYFLEGLFAFSEILHITYTKTTTLIEL